MTGSSSGLSATHWGYQSTDDVRGNRFVMRRYQPTSVNPSDRTSLAVRCGDCGPEIERTIAVAASQGSWSNDMHHTAPIHWLHLPHTGRQLHGGGRSASSFGSGRGRGILGRFRIVRQELGDRAKRSPAKCVSGSCDERCRTLARSRGSCSHCGAQERSGRCGN